MRGGSERRAAHRVVQRDIMVETSISTRSLETFRVAPSSMGSSRGKRIIDIVGSFILLVLCSPLMFAIALAIRLTDSGPVFFAWNILGLGGIPVRSYKFRTMVQNAEQMEATLRAQGQNEMESVYFKVRNDSRVTPIGRILRRYSLDELPSLWSVLKGDMSLVGPRPVRLVEAQYLKPWHAERFSTRPGLTSPWVIAGKTTIRDFDQIASLDIVYIRNWSARHDLRVLAGTILYILAGRNC